MRARAAPAAFAPLPRHLRRSRGICAAPAAFVPLSRERGYFRISELRGGTVTAVPSTSVVCSETGLK